MNPLEYLRLQLRMEGMEIIHDNLLRQVEIVPGEDMPLMIVVQLADDQIIACHDESLYPDVSLELIRQSRHLQFPKVDPLLDILRARGLSFEVGHFKTYTFPARYTEMPNDDVKILDREHHLVQAFGFGGFAERVCTVERDGKVVSACVSVNENEQCAEAWVFTDPGHRHQGFARQVVSAWARDMIGAGKIPFYSHKIDNLASASLARRLGLEPVFEEINISYAPVA